MTAVRAMAHRLLSNLCGATRTPLFPWVAPIRRRRQNRIHSDLDVFAKKPDRPPEGKRPGANSGLGLVGGAAAAAAEVTAALEGRAGGAGTGRRRTTRLARADRLPSSVGGRGALAALVAAEVLLALAARFLGRALLARLNAGLDLDLVFLAFGPRLAVLALSDSGHTHSGEGATGNPLQGLAPALAAGQPRNEFIELLGIHRGVPFPKCRSSRTSLLRLDPRA